MRGKAQRKPGFSHSDETKRKMSEVAKGRKFSAEHRAKLRAVQLLNPMRGWLGKYHYGKIPMRSRWEVIVAKEFDARAIKWKYEPRVFDLGNTSYTPDFYLSERDCWIDVKGWFDAKSKSKIKLFRETYPEEPLIVATKEVLAMMGIGITSLA